MLLSQHDKTMLCKKCRQNVILKLSYFCVTFPLGVTLIIPIVINLITLIIPIVVNMTNLVVTPTRQQEHYQIENVRKKCSILSQLFFLFNKLKMLGIEIFFFFKIELCFFGRVKQDQDLNENKQVRNNHTVCY